uniref:Uncharacterized protein n=1 Tax=Zea mays TaxID=4577 RepID=B6U624_MAIZE|nr:hypothetical protein [Zea mays]
MDVLSVHKLLVLVPSGIIKAYGGTMYRLQRSIRSIFIAEAKCFDDFVFFNCVFCYWFSMHIY